MDWLLVLIAAIIFLMVLVMNLYVLYYYMDPQDKNVAWLPKIVVIVGLSLACYGVLMLPLDVANRNFALGKGLVGASLPVSEMWQVVLLSIVGMILGVIPFTLFYYEESGDGIAVQLKKGIIYGGITLIVSLVVIFIAYSQIGKSEVPMEQYTSQMYVYGSYYETACDPTCQGAFAQSAYKAVDTIKTIAVTFPIFAVGMVSLCGYCFFAVFTGVGLVWLPCSLVLIYTGRPTSLQLSEWADRKQTLKKRAAKLREIGTKLEQENFAKEKLARGDKKIFTKWQNAVYLLEKDFELLRLQKTGDGDKINILYYMFMGFNGIIGCFVSLAWVIHMVLFVFLDNMHPFLNDLLVWLDTQWSLLGTIGYASFTFYLLWCTVIGVLKLGLRVGCCFSIHPMEPGKTMMNSFLFNVGIILLCEIPCIQFCTNAFSIYARVTAISVIFGTQIQYLQGISVLWKYNIFLYIMAAMILFTVFFVICKGPKDNSKEMEDQVESHMKLKMSSRR